MDTKDTSENTALSVAPAKPAPAPKPAGEPEPEEPVPSVPLSGLGDDSQKDVLDWCPNSFDEIMQVLVLKNRPKAASRASSGCGLNQ